MIAPYHGDEVRPMEDGSEYLPFDAKPLPYEPDQAEFDPGTRIDLTSFPEKFHNPLIAPGSHVSSARAVIKHVLETEDTYNTVFLTEAEELIKRHYTPLPDRFVYDVVTPGTYKGDNLNLYWAWVGAQFDGCLEQTNIYACVDKRAGYVRQLQIYEAKNVYSNEPVRWVMRQTDGVICIDGQWKVAHSHFSWPADINTLVVDVMSRTQPLPWRPESYRYREDRQVVDGKLIMNGKADAEISE